MAAKHRMLRTTPHNIKLMALAHMTATPVWTKTRLTGLCMRINRGIGSKSSIKAIFTGPIMQFLAEAWRPELNFGKVIGAPLRVTTLSLASIQVRLIVGKHSSARFGWFLHINYPNAEDQARFERSRAEHLIPASAREGGQIGIHGTDSPYLNVSDINWTTGCISVDNADIRELAYLLPVGTLVVINP
jgi:hypothetical protein